MAGVGGSSPLSSTKKQKARNASCGPFFVRGREGMGALTEGNKGNEGEREASLNKETAEEAEESSRDLVWMGIQIRFLERLPWERESRTWAVDQGVFNVRDGKYAARASRSCCAMVSRSASSAASWASRCSISRALSLLMISGLNACALHGSQILRFLHLHVGGEWR